MPDTSEKTVINTYAEAIRAAEISICAGRLDAAQSTPASPAESIPAGVTGYTLAHDGYVFNVRRGIQAVTVTFDPLGIAEQRRVRKLNEAMKDSR